MECKGCRFFVLKETSSSEADALKFGSCVINPPVEIPDPGNGSFTIFPMPYTSSVKRPWCGKHEPAPTPDSDGAIEAEQTKPAMWIKSVERRDDMGEGRLRVSRDDDGDMYVSLRLAPGASSLSGVEFCTPGNGGGKSPRTFRALQALAEAMQKDNEEQGDRHDASRAG